MSESVQVGRLITGNPGRDAIHVAVAPVTAGDDGMEPGAGAGFVGRDRDTAYLVGRGEGAVGIVDPFLTEPVRRGQRFYLFLFPNTVTSLRHVWTHPAFAP